MRQAFESAMKKILGFRCFVSDIISGLDFRPFWLKLPGPGPNPKMEVFQSSFLWKLG